MSKNRSVGRHQFAVSSLNACVLLALAAGASAARAEDPIRIGVIAESQAIAGASIPQAAQMAADEINAAGGLNGRKVEVISYDNKSSATDSVNAFQAMKSARMCTPITSTTSTRSTAT
jgi:branched-chain amino acid transport system substrate-binding protein